MLDREHMRKSICAFAVLILSLAYLWIGSSFTSAKEKPAVAPDGPDRQLEEFRFDDLETAIHGMQEGPERDYFAGMLANRAGHTADSIQLLNNALPALKASHPDRAALALHTLADDYNKSFQYADADRTYDDLLNHFSGEVSPEELRSAKDDAGIAHILRDAPAQTISWDGAVRLKTERNPLNSVNAQLTVNGVSAPWLLDTGANISVVRKSFAERLGLKFLTGAAQTQGGLTGIENPLHVALLSTLQMGGATLHNVVVMVLDDANLNISLGKYSYQINGIIGYPVFQALGAITFLRAGEFAAGNGTQVAGSGTRMYMNLLTPVIECSVEGKNLPFSFDTGAAGSEMSVRYYREFLTESKTWKKGKAQTAGAGGVITKKIYSQPVVKLGVGDKTVILKDVPISVAPAGTDHDKLYGNLGQDLVASFEGFTVDFSTMTFTLGAPLSPDLSHTKP
jgi:hypothetical protein